MGKHIWVELKITPLDVELEADGSVRVMATEEAIAIAGEDAIYGCWFCNASLSTDNVNEECELQK